MRAGVIEPGEDRRHSQLRHGWDRGSQAFAERMLQLAEKGMATRRNRTYRSAANVSHKFADTVPEAEVDGALKEYLQSVRNRIDLTPIIRMI